MMRPKLDPRHLILALIICAVPIVAAAQTPPPADGPQDARFAPRPGEPRPNLFMELGLTREQVQALRRINADRKPAEISARERFQDANRALNMAIYADTIDESEFRARLSEFQAAQAELARIKFTNELAVRRLLTPPQLQKFRELRRRFAEEREGRVKDSSDKQDRPPMRRGGQMRPPIN